MPHQAPWDWRVSLYTWTKSVAAGGFAVPVVLAFAGILPWGNAAARWAAPVVALAFLAGDRRAADRGPQAPERFYLIFTRHHWRSWLVRGAFILGGFGGAVAGYLSRRWPALPGPGRSWAAGLPLAAGAAVYTAYLFAQAKARDMWQSPLLAPHLAVQAALAGAAAALPLLAWLAPGTGGDRGRGDPGGRGRRPPGAGGRRDHAAARHGARPAGRRRR